ncbi:hypothetical protein [Bdellovibrio sp. NC01]|uniref:hypothetical protein n=1 Tax=Bdellovibrio sp. NC01 TaxID=2220073 RepID=UPI0011579776|nr:hypothetical protein [Bdellovibrio sp. NC01]QDK39068.1 hypothetical protein DOE51_16475 [Bdellovibrio sp. NC01]
MKKLALLLALLISTQSYAQPAAGRAEAPPTSKLKMPSPPEAPVDLQVYPLGVEMRYERNENQEFETHNFMNFAFALKKKNLAALIEYSRYTQDSGNSTSGVNLTHQEMLLWGEWHFVQSEAPEGFMSIYGGLGLGAYNEEIKTTLMGASQTDDGGYKVISALKLGASAGYNLNHTWALVAALEGRALFASDFDPNPIPSGVLRVGFSYKLK